LHPVQIDSAKKNGFILNKQNTDAELTEGLENGFVKTLTLSPKGEDKYFVVFSSSPDPTKQAKKCCKYKGWGIFRNDSVFVEIANLQKPLTLVISHGIAESIQPELVVSTLNEKDKNTLKDFCCGGKTLAGKYVLKSSATDE